MLLKVCFLRDFLSWFELLLGEGNSVLFCFLMTLRVRRNISILLLSK